MQIPFNRPYVTGKELNYIQEAYANLKLSGDGIFTKKTELWLEAAIGCKKALLTNSCTAALEMSAILLNLQPGDEIIMPSFTFVSTANAFVLRGGVPVFVDIREDTFNIDESKIESAITPKTKAIVPVHYAGVACEMDIILKIAEKYGLFVIEDAAQGISALYKGIPLGRFGHMAALSFHETKNIISGEGGALLINDDSFLERADIIREKGTNRKLFFNGKVDKYTWMDIGSSFLPNEITAAFLLAQMEQADSITQKRLDIWDAYFTFFSKLENLHKLRCPIIPQDCKHNAHMFYLLLHSLKERSELILNLENKGINAVFHYVPLHSSPAGKKYCRTHGALQVTNYVADRLVRMPLWVGLEHHMTYLLNHLESFFYSQKVSTG